MRYIILIIMLSLTLSPIAGSAQALMPMQEVQTASVEHTAGTHDCCDDTQQMLEQAKMMDCDGKCGDCQQHCSSFSFGLLTAQLNAVAFHDVSLPTAKQSQPSQRAQKTDRPPKPTTI